MVDIQHKSRYLLSNSPWGVQQAFQGRAGTGRAQQMSSIKKPWPKQQMLLSRRGSEQGIKRRPWKRSKNTSRVLKDAMATNTQKATAAFALALGTRLNAADHRGCRGAPTPGGAAGQSTKLHMLCATWTAKRRQEPLWPVAVGHHQRLWQTAMLWKL